ncbi:hypothetical protein H5410_062767 [Solanum commersonii]|uniref:Uncharacterized protein n=1 Tax=Solanum commersonii TaxID=4109 RepID=A0A9J5WBJ6_SOLCO|nr:hypothetical protein H5410_062767 [Solanum commersonii]
MADIDNYQNSSVDSSDNVESSEGESNSEESSRDTSRDEEDPLSLPICARDIFGELYDLATWLDEVGSFPVKITIRSRMTFYRDFRKKIMVEQKLYNEFKDDLNFFKSYPWGKESFDLTLTYLKKQGKMYNENKNASYALYDFPWEFLVWIYEAFSYLEKYAGKSLDTPLTIPRLLRWSTSKSDNIVEGDPFRYKEKSTQIVHTYLTLTVREMEQNCMATFKSYTNEVKDAVIDVLKAQLKGVIVLTAGVESADDEYLENLTKRVVSLEQSMVEVVVYVRDEKLRKIEKNKKTRESNIIHVNITTADEDFVVIEEYLTDGVDEVAIDVVDKVTGDDVFEVAVDVVDEVAGDAVAVDDVAINAVVVDLVDEVGVVVVDEAVGDIVDEVAYAVDLVAVDVVDEVACVANPVAVDVIDEVIDVVDEKEEKGKEKSVDDEEDDSVENSVDVISIVIELNGDINGDEKNN